MTLRPYADNVLVLPDWLRDKHTEQRSAGGIILPQTATDPKDEDPVLATVIVAGPGFYDEPIAHDEGIPGWKRPKGSRKFIPTDVKAGDRVLVSAAILGEPYFVDGVEHRIVRACNIVGVVTEDVAA